MPHHEAMAAPESFLTFGDLLVYLRKRARLTQEELGGAVGYSRTQITLLEKNQRLPSTTTVRALFIPALDLDESPTLARRLIDLAMKTRRPHTNLPSSVNALIGREHEAAEVQSWLLMPDRRLVTLIGPPGIGKTRLSLQVASDLLPDFPDGVFFVSLAPVENPALLASVILQSIAIKQTKQQSPLESLKQSLKTRQMMIVLDNFEHIVEAAPLVSELLSACSRLKLIVTSREPLHVSGEWLYPVPPLSMPDKHQLKNLAVTNIDHFPALRLFAERAHAVLIDFTLTSENIATVAAICRQLDGLPLAIELIASRIRLMPPQTLLQRLTDDFTLHADGMRNLPTRQRTLHNAIDWSYALLSQVEQMLLRRLAVFAGGWTLEAAGAVGAGDGIEAHEIESILFRLIDKSLVRAEPSSEELRFSMLETVRQYAHDKLAESRETDRVKTGHLGYYLRFAEAANNNLFGAAQSIWLERLDIEYPNLLAALAWAEASHQAETEMRLAVALGYFWYIRLYMNDGAMWLECALSGRIASGGIPTGLQANALLWLSEIKRLQTDFTAAKAHADESKRLFQAIGDRVGLADVIRAMSGIALAERRYPDARLLLEESLSLQGEAGNPHNTAWVLNALGEVARAQNDYALAENFYLKALDLFSAAADEFRISSILLNLGLVALQQGNYAQAEERLQKSLKIARKINELGNSEGCLIGLAGLIGARGDYALAVKVLGAADVAIKVHGGQLDSPDQIVYEHILAELHTQLDEAAFATAWSEGQKLDIEQAIGLASSGEDGYFR